MEIIWLASYPKSGNTFLRALLYSYFFEPLSANSALVNERIPDIHKLAKDDKGLNEALNQTCFVKTHFMMSEKHPYQLSTKGFIYVLRNPRDVLHSAARYLGANGTKETMASFASDFINGRGWSGWQGAGYGDWVEHVGSWLATSSKVPHLFLRYEDLRQDARGQMLRVLSFLNSSVDDEKLDRTIRCCTIESMRALEATEKAKMSPTLFDELFNIYRPEEKNKQPFVGEGLINQSLDLDGTGLLERAYTDRFGKLTGVFGYY